MQLKIIIHTRRTNRTMCTSSGICRRQPSWTECWVQLGLPMVTVLLWRTSTIRPWLHTSRSQSRESPNTNQVLCNLGLPIDAGVSLASSLHWPGVQLDQQPTACREVFLTGTKILSKVYYPSISRRLTSHPTTPLYYTSLG